MSGIGIFKNIIGIGCSYSIYSLNKYLYDFFRAEQARTQFDTLEVYSRSIKQNNKSIKREIYILGTK